MENNLDRQQISDYYDTFREEEKVSSPNLRHYKVLQHLLKTGLQKHHDALEIGCGFGTVTSLIAKYLRAGTLLATDISTERIASCRKKFAAYPNVQFLLTDMTTFTSEKKFDYIILPDVLEHIPIDVHDRLFSIMAAHLKPNGKIIIHIPHPKMIAYLRKNNPSVLQIIDQEVHSDKLIQNAYKNGLTLDFIHSYSLANFQNDYQIISFTNAPPYSIVAPLTPIKIIWKKLIARTYFIWHSIF